MKGAIAFAALNGFSVACFGLWQLSKFVRDERKLKELLDEEVDALSTDFVSDDGRQEALPSVLVTKALTVYDERAAMETVHDAINRATVLSEVSINADTEVTRGVATLSMSKVDVAQHRVVARRKRAPYMNTVVATCRLTFGVCVRSEANEKAVRRVAVNIMKEHGVRPTHMNKMLPYIVELVFIPSNDDIEAKALARGWASWFRTWRLNGVWNWFVPSFLRFSSPNRA
nr:MAG: RNA-dependent RNA polymerase [Crogonang virus 49]